MPSTPLIAKIGADYPLFIFKAADGFSWSSTDTIVTFKEDDENLEALLLHELSHGLLSHSHYSKDVELVAMESNAWDKALEIAPTYGVTIDDETVQSHLDTYREWLHARSTCPHCEATGHQTAKNRYSCVACGHSWRVNEARICALRRYNK